jgi:hypothetical protein
MHGFAHLHFHTNAVDANIAVSTLNVVTEVTRQGMVCLLPSRSKNYIQASHPFLRYIAQLETTQLLLAGAKH